MHLNDPLRALIQAYEALAPGGIMIIDQFTLEGLTNRYRDILLYLQAKGYEVLIDYNAYEILFLMIRKTRPHLVIPIQYANNIKGSCIYDASQLPHYPMETSVEFKEADLNRRLINLISSPGYIAMNKKQRLDAIYDVVNVIPPSEKYLYTILTNEERKRIYRIVCAERSMHRLPYLFYLMNESDEGKLLTEEDKLALLKLVAWECLQKLVLKEIYIKELQKFGMGIDLLTIDRKTYCSTAPLMLTFKYMTDPYHYLPAPIGFFGRLLDGLDKVDAKHEKSKAPLQSIQSNTDQTVSPLLPPEIPPLTNPEENEDEDPQASCPSRAA